MAYKIRPIRQRPDQFVDIDDRADSIQNSGQIADLDFLGQRELVGAAPSLVEFPIAGNWGFGISPTDQAFIVFRLKGLVYYWELSTTAVTGERALASGETLDLTSAVAQTIFTPLADAIVTKCVVRGATGVPAANLRVSFGFNGAANDVTGNTDLDELTSAAVATVIHSQEGIAINSTAFKALITNPIGAGAALVDVFGYYI